MANNRLSVSKILEVLKLFFELGRSKREIARVNGASPTTVSGYLARTRELA
jgi:predicted transcriptional regulator